MTVLTRGAREGETCEDHEYGEPQNVRHLERIEYGTILSTAKGDVPLG